MKLKEIPANTVVHTPTEEEAKELLAILHENGNKWCSDAALTGVSNFHVHNGDTCYCLEPPYVTFRPKNWFIREGYIILTFAEFKERYCEEDEPQLKFHLGERIRIVSSGEEDFINMITNDDCYELLEHSGKYIESDLEPYTEPETKPTAKETKESKETFASEELNICELLKGHEGQSFYSPCYGDVDLIEVHNDKIIISTVANDKKHTLGKRGKHYAGFAECMCMLFPSRTLYEQYPLNPHTAWLKWQEEQKRYLLRFVCCRGNDEPITEFEDVYFRNRVDREQAIEELQAIIEKYSKK